MPGSLPPFNPAPLQRYIQSGTNLFDPNDSDVLLGQYIGPDTSGLPLANASYNTTGFIPVDAGQTYIVSSSGASSNTAVSQRRTFWDINKQYIGGTGAGQPAIFTVPAGAAYIRIVVARQYWPNFQVEVGSTNSAYAPPQKRIATTLPQNPLFRESLRQTHYLLTKLALPTPEAAQVIINLAGDSYTFAPTRWSGSFASILMAKYGDAGGGWCGFGFLPSGGTTPWASGNQPNYVGGNVRPATYGIRLFGGIVGQYYNRPSPDLASATLSTSGDAVEQDFPASPTVSGIDLHWIGTGNGSIRYGYAAQGSTPSSWTTLSVSGTSGTAAVTALSLTGITQPGTLRIEWVSGTAEIAGVNLKSATNGVRVNKIAATGSAASQWAGLNMSSLTALGGNLFFYMDGPNSQASTGQATWGTQLNAILNRARLAIPGIDILIATPPENQRTTNTYAIAGYAAEARRRSYFQQFAYLDLQPAFGISGDPTEYGSAGVVPLFATDLLHPDPPTGGRLIAAEILRVVQPF